MIHVVRFVGGGADKKTYAFPDFPPRYFEVAVAPPLRYLWTRDTTADKPAEITFAKETYRLTMMPGRDKDFYVYRPDSWSLDDMYEHLLFGELNG